MLLIISDGARCLAIKSFKTGVYTILLKTKGFISNIHLFYGYCGGHIFQTVNFAFYLWLLNIAESNFNYLTVKTDFGFEFFLQLLTMNYSKLT
jgi:hypothetical protein